MSGYEVDEEKEEKKKKKSKVILQGTSVCVVSLQV